MVTTSDEDGAFAFEDVPFGRWIVREITSPEGYVLNEALHYVSVTEDEEVIEVELINKLIEGSVRLTKVDAEYPANKLTGAVFELYADTDKDHLCFLCLYGILPFACIASKLLKNIR